MPLAIQTWLRDFDSCFPGQQELALKKLEDDFSIKAKRHSEFPELVQLKYNQIESPFKEELVQDCRGIILDSSKNWQVVCFSYRKFFNQGESLAADIHWPSARVFEKMDGSLIQLYFYKGHWRVATSGTPDALCPVGDFGKTFRQLFWDTFDAEGIDLNGLDKDCCYAFELCTPLNRVVVQHAKAALYLHGIRDLATLAERNIMTHADNIGANFPFSYEMSTLEECFAAAKVLDPLKHEGYVVRDGLYRRVKIKSPSYVALHHAKDGLLSRRMMANTIRAGEFEELWTALNAFPELAKEFERLQTVHETLLYMACTTYTDVADIESQKEFALRVKDFPISGILFDLRRHKVPPGPAALAHARTYLSKLTENAYGRLIGIRE